MIPNSWIGRGHPNESCQWLGYWPSCRFWPRSFIQATDGLASLLSSIKRTTIPGLELDSSYQSFGYLRSVAALGRVALLLLAAHYFLQPGRIAARRWVALGSLLLIAQVLPWYTSSRTGVLFLLIEVLVVWFAAGRRLDMKRTIIVALSILIVFQIMTSAREYGASATPRELLSPFVPGEAVVLDAKHARDCNDLTRRKCCRPRTGTQEWGNDRLMAICSSPEENLAGQASRTAGTRGGNEGLWNCEKRGSGGPRW